MARVGWGRVEWGGEGLSLWWAVYDDELDELVQREEEPQLAFVAL